MVNSCVNETEDSPFSLFLKKIRNQSKLSQEQLAVYLRKHSSLFYNLDTLTVSRWERGVNTPSLAKQAEIAQLFKLELTDIYYSDRNFIKDSESLIALDPLTKSIHPYYCNQPIQIHTIAATNLNFNYWLKVITNYEKNPLLLGPQVEKNIHNYGNVYIKIALAYENQIVGHSLHIETSSKSILKFINLNTQLSDENQNPDSIVDSMLVLSSFGASKSIENGMLSSYIRFFSKNKNLEYIYFSVVSSNFIKSLSKYKLKPFKTREIVKNKNKIVIYSYLQNRNEILTNNFFLKLAIISKEKLSQLLNSEKKS